MYICPECHKSLKNKHSLDEHLKRLHGSQPAEVKSRVKSEPKSKAKDFKVKVGKEQKEEKTTYKCGSCGSPLSGEVSQCPSCGAELNWS